MIDTRFWVISRAQLQFLTNCEIHQNELITISFGACSGGQCHLTADGFIRLGKQFGIKKATFSAYGTDQPRFRHEGVEFVCVCTNAEIERVAAEFEMLQEFV